MTIIPDIEKWTADKEFYNKSFLIYLKNSWSKALKAYNKKLEKVKTEKYKNQYLNLINEYNESLFKLDIILQQL